MWFLLGSENGSVVAANVKAEQEDVPEPAPLRDAQAPAANPSHLDVQRPAGGLTAVAPTSPLMQLTKQEFTPDPSVASDAGQDGLASRPLSPSGSVKQDPRMVFMYLKTNKFDDTGDETSFLDSQLDKKTGEVRVGE